MAWWSSIPSNEYGPLSAPRRAVLYTRGTTFDVIIVRILRGRVRIRLPDGATEPILVNTGDRNVTLRPGKTTSVPDSMIELRDAP